MISKEQAEYLKSLSSADGIIDPEGVVALARDPSNPLHERFEWDDGVAGHQHRVDTARRLIRFCKLEVTIERQTVIAPFYVPDPHRPPKSRRLVALSTIGDDTDRARAILQGELDRCASQLGRARQVAAVLGLGGPLESAIDRIVALRDRVAMPPPTRTRARARQGRHGAR